VSRGASRQTESGPDQPERFPTVSTARTRQKKISAEVSENGRRRYRLVSEVVSEEMREAKEASRATSKRYRSEGEERASERFASAESEETFQKKRTFEEATVSPRGDTGTGVEGAAVSTAKTQVSEEERVLPQVSEAMTRQAYHAFPGRVTASDAAAIPFESKATEEKPESFATWRRYETGVLLSVEAVQEKVTFAELVSTPCAGARREKGEGEMVSGRRTSEGIKRHTARSPQSAFNGFPVPPTASILPSD
jgi:hypothetical protein